MSHEWLFHWSHMSDNVLPLPDSATCMSALENAINEMEILMEQVSPIQPKPVSKSNSVATDEADQLMKDANNMGCSELDSSFEIPDSYNFVKPRHSYTR